MSTAETTCVSSKEMAVRQDCLDSLEEFIDKCQEDITSMLDTLGWTPEHFMQPRNLCECPNNTDHMMPKMSLEKHSKLCSIISQGYGKEEAEKIVEDRSFFYKAAACVHPVTLDLETLNSVLWNHHVQNHSVFYGYKKVPQTAEEEQILMSREDRLGIAEYVVKRAKEANRLKELGQDELLVSENLADLMKKGDNEERKLDPFEEMAALRDYRRRRQTYRAKNVHITKKSHTEIMREVINNQMEMYSQTIREETGMSSQQMSDSEVDVGSRRNKTEDGGRHRDGDDRSRNNRESRRYARSRSRSRDRSVRSSRRSRSRSRDRSSRHSRTDKDEHSGTSASRRTSRSRSHDSDKSKYKRKKRSRSRSYSSERSKKSKHKKHKHKHKKHKKSDRKSEDKQSGDKGDNNDKILQDK